MDIEFSPVLSSTRRKHVVFWRWYSAEAVWGGAESHLLSYLQSLDPSRARATVLTNKDLFGERLSEADIPARVVTHSSYREAPRARQYLTILRLLWRLRADQIVIVQGAFTDFHLSELILASLACLPRFRRPVEFHMSAPAARLEVSRLGVLSWLKARLRGRVSSTVVVVSEGARRRIINWYGYPASRVRVVHHGVSLGRFALQDTPREAIRSRIRQALGIPGDSTVVVSTARFSPEKRMNWVVNAVLGHSRAFPEVHWIFLGDGPERPALEHLLMNDAFCAPRVHFLGFVSDVRDYLFASDVFILASEIEGLSNALLEAMAAGLLCVCTRTPGTEDVIEHGQNGLIAELDLASVSSQLFSALQMTPRIRSTIQAAAKATVFSRFDVKDGIGRGMDVLELPMRDRENTTPPQG